MHRNQKRLTLKHLYAHNTDGGAGDGVAPNPGVEISTSEGSVSTEVPMEQTVTPDTTPAVDEEFSKFIPDDYKDKPWVQNLLKSEKPKEELFKQMGELQTKIGQRPAGIPGEDATEEEWKAFNKALGVPETPDEYDLKPTEFGDDLKEISEFINSSRGSDEFQKDIKAMFHEVGIPPAKAQALMEKYDNLFVKHNKASFDAIVQAQREEANKLAEQDEDFNTKVTKEFGTKADAVLNQGRKLLEENVPESLRESFRKLDNDAAIIMAAALGSIAKKYVKEDSSDPTPGGDKGTSEEEFRKEMREIMASDAYNDVTHPDYEMLQRKVKEGYQRQFGSTKKP